VTSRSYIVSANSNNEHFDADCNFAVITLSPALLKNIAELRGAYNDVLTRIKNFTSLEARDVTVAFISGISAENILGVPEFERMERATSNDEDPFPVKDGVAWPLDKIEAHSDYVHVDGRGIWWKTYPKHSDVIVETNQIPWGWFSRCKHCAKEKTAHAKGNCLFSSTTYEANCVSIDGGSKVRRPRKVSSR